MRGRRCRGAELGVEAPEGVLDDGIVGAQMWLALPDATRDGPSRFEHHAELPAVDVGSGQARVIAGELDGARSPARVDHPALGLAVSFRGTVDVPLAPRFEHGVVPVDRPLMVEEAIVEPGSLALLPAGFDSLRIEERAGRLGSSCWAGSRSARRSRCGGTSPRGYLRRSPRPGGPGRSGTTIGSRRWPLGLPASTPRLRPGSAGIPEREHQPRRSEGR